MIQDSMSTVCLGHRWCPTNFIFVERLQTPNKGSRLHSRHHLLEIGHLDAVHVVGFRSEKKRLRICLLEAVLGVLELLGERDEEREVKSAFSSGKANSKKGVNTLQIEYPVMFESVDLVSISFIESRKTVFSLLTGLSSVESSHQS